MVTLFIISLLIMGAILALSWNQLPPQVPLLYSLSEPDAHVVDTIYLGFLPLISAVFLLIHTTIAKKYFRENALIQDMLLYANYAIIFMTTFIFVRILLLVT